MAEHIGIHSFQSRYRVFTPYGGYNDIHNSVWKAFLKAFMKMMRICMKGIDQRSGKITGRYTVAVTYDINASVIGPMHFHFLNNLAKILSSEIRIHMNTSSFDQIFHKNRLGFTTSVYPTYPVKAILIGDLLRVDENLYPGLFCFIPSISAMGYYGIIRMDRLNPVKTCE